MQQHTACLLNQPINLVCPPAEILIWQILYTSVTWPPKHFCKISPEAGLPSCIRDQGISRSRSQWRQGCVFWKHAPPTITTRRNTTLSEIFTGPCPPQTPVGFLK
ncbi:hypothetical protein IG631_16046 [Alternaria alternata]|nr:hypothetical protein IG631_16046 [Alternaria alternata]